MLNLQEILNSEIGEIARGLDANDGSYDGLVSIAVFNDFLKKNGFRLYDARDGVEAVPLTDVAKMIYHLKQEQISTGATTIKVDFDPVEEMRKAREQYNKMHF